MTQLEGQPLWSCSLAGAHAIGSHGVNPSTEAAVSVCQARTLSPHLPAFHPCLALCSLSPPLTCRRASSVTSMPSSRMLVRRCLASAATHPRTTRPSPQHSACPSHCSQTHQASCARYRFSLLGRVPGGGVCEGAVAGLQEWQGWCHASSCCPGCWR